MAAFRAAEQLLRKRTHPAPVVPVAEPAAYPGLVAGLAVEARVGVDLGEGGVHGGDVAAVSVEEVAPFESMPGEGLHDVAHHRDEGARAQGDGAGEPEVVLGHADAQRRRHHDVDLLAHPARHYLGTQRIGADEPVGSVLLGRSDGDDDAVRSFEVGVDFLPGGELKQHGRPPPAPAGDVRRSDSINGEWAGKHVMRTGGSAIAGFVQRDMSDGIGRSGASRTGAVALRRGRCTRTRRFGNRAAMSRMSGPATGAPMRCRYEVFGDVRFELSAGLLPAVRGSSRPGHARRRRSWHSLRTGLQTPEAHHE